MSRRKTDLGRRIVPASEFKAHCLRLLDEVAEGGELVITKRGKPIARLTAISPSPRSDYGRWKGLVQIKGNIVQSDWSEDFDATRE